MTADDSTQQGALATNLKDGRGLLNANQLAEAIKERWRNGETPDVTAALASHPELRCYRTVVLDLAYQEYLHRSQAGEAIDVETFSRRLPSFQRSLHLFIAVHDLVSRDPDHQPLQDRSSWPEPGGRFLQFDLVAEIGRGSFGRVFLATEPALGRRQVVVKVAPQGGEEADILGRLHHSNIVPIYSLQKDATGLTAFCMPYLGRATLCDVLDYAFLDPHPPRQASIILDAVATANDDSDSSESPRPDAILEKGGYVNGILHVAVQLADALAHSHGRGICHRDLKPSNVLMTPDGRPLLLDFNLSVDQRAPTARIGGTVPYMAPEELAVLFDKSRDAARRHYDPRSDVFSLGVIVYQLLTGVLPFGALPCNASIDDLALQLRQRQRQGPRPLRAYNRQVDSRLAGLLESCLAFEPDERPETARELATALRRELALVRRSRRWMGNHRRLVGGASTIALTSILTVGLFLALRPSYGVRQLHLGIACNEQGKYTEAVDHLNNAILADPASPEALFARGHAYQGLGQFQTAFQDYHVAYQLEPSPLFKACEGYCLSLIKSHKAAIAAYQLALEKGYGSPAVLYANMGYGYSLMGQMDAAEKHLERAIQLDGHLQAPRYTIVSVFLRRASQGQSIPDAAFAHAAKAIEIGPRTADLYRNVGVLYARAALRNPSLVQPAIHYVEKAVELGFNPKAIASDVSFSALQQEPAFHKALARRGATSKAPKVIQLLDPLATP
jgi:eukaryotic-like serine/threonine-protein kinase